MDNWEWKRYYEEKDIQDAIQRKKQKFEKVLLIIIVVLALAANIIKLLVQFKILSDDKIDFTSSAFNVTQEGTDSSANVLTGKLIDDADIKTTLLLVVHYIDACKPFAIHLLISLFLIYYFISLTCRKSFSPIHSMIKLLLLYNVIAAVPSAHTVNRLVLNLRELGLDINEEKSFDISLWFVSCLPFIVLLPIIPYLLTRSCTSLFVDIKRFISGIMNLFGMIFKGTNLHRFAHVCSAILGSIAFISISMAFVFPWFDLIIQPEKDLGMFFDNHAKLEKDVIVMEDYVRKYNCFLGNPDQLEFDKIPKVYPLCFDGTLNDPTCQNVTTAYNKNKAYIEKENVGCQPFDDCEYFLSMTSSAYGLFENIYTARGGNHLLKAARIMQKINLILRQLKKTTKVTRHYKAYMGLLGSFFQRPIKLVQVSFIWDLTFLMFILPAFFVGVFAVSVGFWKRDSAAGTSQILKVMDRIDFQIIKHNL